VARVEGDQPGHQVDELHRVHIDIRTNDQEMITYKTALRLEPVLKGLDRLPRVRRLRHPST